MNKELIQKLFNKSCWDEQEEVDIEDFISVEKLIELTVRECIDVCANGWQGEFTAAGISQCVSDLKEHFGVEE
jgi:hypothetical protein